MDGQTIDIIVMIAYLACVVLIGYYSMNQIEDFDDYAVAGRSIPAALIFGTIGATLCGGGATIGRISFVHKQGLIVFVALIGVVVCQIFSGLLIAPRVRQIGRNVYTISDLFGLYLGRAGRLSSSLVAFFFLMSMMGVQLLAMGRILETILNMDFVVATVLSTVITVTYTWAGGMIAVLLTDAVQFVVIALGLSIAAYLGLEQVGGLTNAVDIITSRSPESAMLLDFFRDDWSPLKLGAFFLAFMLGDMCTPYYNPTLRHGGVAQGQQGRRDPIQRVLYFLSRDHRGHRHRVGVHTAFRHPGSRHDLACTDHPSRRDQRAGHGGTARGGHVYGRLPLQHRGGDLHP